MNDPSSRIKLVAAIGCGVLLSAFAVAQGVVADPDAQPQPETVDQPMSAAPSDASAETALPETKLPETAAPETMEADDDLMPGMETGESPAILPPVAAPPASESALQRANQAYELEMTGLRGLLDEGSAVERQRQSISPLLSDVPQLPTVFEDTAGLSPLENVTAFGLPLTALNAKGHFHPYFLTSAIYDDNLNISSNHKEHDWIFALTPGFTINLGEQESAFLLTGNYAANFLLYVPDTNLNTVDQNATFHARYAFPKLTLGLNAALQDASGASVDAGQRVHRQIYYGGLTSSYVLDEKFSLSLNADGTVSNYNGLLDSSQETIQGWVNYQVSGKTSVSAGGSFGVLDVTAGNQQTFEEALVRASYQATGKIVLNANAGVDIRQGDGNSVNPVFGIGATYTPGATTTLLIDLHERIYASATLVKQDYTETGVAFTVRQTVLNNLSIDLSAGYEHSEYYSVSKDVPANRTDNFVVGRLGPSFHVTRWCNLTAFYEFSKDASSGIGGNSFTRNRAGFQANFIF